MDAVIPPGQAMPLLMAADTAGVEVSGEALGQDMVGAGDMVEALAGKGIIPLPEHGMDQTTIHLMEAPMP